MTVKTILEHKGREVTTVTRNLTLSEAAKIMAERNIGAVVVVDSRSKVLGILSERDIVGALARSGGAVLDKPVAAFMTTKVVQCRQSNTVNEVMEIMTNGRFRHLPVDEDGELVGIISIGDVVRRRIEEVEREAAEMKAYITS